MSTAELQVATEDRQEPDGIKLYILMTTPGAESIVQTIHILDCSKFCSLRVSDSGSSSGVTCIDNCA